MGHRRHRALSLLYFNSSAAGRVVGLSVGWLVGWLVDWLVGQSVGRSVGWLVGWLVHNKDCRGFRRFPSKRIRVPPGL